MNAKRLKQIEKIYHAAVKTPPGERELFFREHCGADAQLQGEVESLLAFENTFDSFIDAPPESLAAEMLIEETTAPPLSGTEISHYQIKRLLGKGGMGEVYLAKDANLNRQVALKFLSASIFDNKDPLRRFEQEAFAASALNHPNILTIYEFDAKGETCFLATEYIEGETLREWLNRGKLTLKEALNVAEQIAFALAAAHKAKIIHRDIKPENIMLRAEDGLAKILDFGLAKLTEKGDLFGSPADSDRKLTLTQPGALMGTVAYMSPEQVRGLAEVDARTDIWSAGVVLFEMVAGHPAFAGETAGDTIAAILQNDAPRLSEFVANCPPELERMIGKALAKNVEERYQTMRDFALDIKNLNLNPKFVQTLDSAQRRPEKSRAVVLALAFASVLIIGIIGALSVWKFNGSDTSVQSVAATTSAAIETASQKPALSLNYSLTIQSYSDGRYKNPFKLSGEMLFRNKDRVRLNVASPQNGFLYILNQSPPNESGSTSLNILFPTPTTNNGAAQLPAEREIQIPQQSWFELDDREGTELVWLVWSKTAIAELESAKRFANPTDRGKIKDAALTESIETLLRKYQSNKANVIRDDEKKESQITANVDILAHIIKLEHH